MMDERTLLRGYAELMKWLYSPKAYYSRCEAHLRRTLADELRRNDVTEHHGRDALCYDLKVEGGIPFPLFAEASEEYAELEFAIDWVNVAAGEHGTDDDRTRVLDLTAGIRPGNIQE